MRTPNVCAHLCEGECFSSSGIEGSGVELRPRREASPAAAALQSCLTPPHLQAVTEVLQCCAVLPDPSSRTRKKHRSSRCRGYQQLSNRMQSLIKTWHTNNIGSRQMWLVVFLCFGWCIKMSHMQSCPLFWLPWLATLMNSSGQGRLLVWWSAGVLWETVSEVKLARKQ